jgi:hypothetical protein
LLEVRENCSFIVTERARYVNGGLGTGDEPEWITYYDQSRLERDNGRALLGLALNGGAFDEAERRLCSSIQASAGRSTKLRVSTPRDRRCWPTVTR